LINQFGLLFAANPAPDGSDSLLKQKAIFCCSNKATLEALVWAYKKSLLQNN